MNDRATIHALMERWYLSPAGQYALQQECHWLKKLLPPGVRRIAHMGPSVGHHDVYQSVCEDVFYCRENADKTLNKNFVQILMDYDALPFMDDSFNAIVLCHLPELLPITDEMIAEYTRVLAPDGHLIILGCNPRSMWGIRRWWKKDESWLWWRERPNMCTIIKQIECFGLSLMASKHEIYKPYQKSEAECGVHMWLEIVAKLCCPNVGSLACYVFKKSVSSWVPPSMLSMPVGDKL